MGAESPSSHRDAEPGRLDPVFVHARREGLLILALWAACMVWTLGCSYLLGYHVDPGEVSMIGGVPAWVVWGVAVPWLVATVVTAWFCFGYMADDELGGASDEGDGPAHE